MMDPDKKYIELDYALSKINDIKHKIMDAAGISEPTRGLLIGHILQVEESLGHKDNRYVSDLLIKAAETALKAAKSHKPLSERKEGVRLALSGVLRKEKNVSKQGDTGD